MSDVPALPRLGRPAGRPAIVTGAGSRGQGFGIGIGKAITPLSG